MNSRQLKTKIARKSDKKNYVPYDMFCNNYVQYENSLSDQPVQILSRQIDLVVLYLDDLYSEVSVEVIFKNM